MEPNEWNITSETANASGQKYTREVCECLCMCLWWCVCVCVYLYVCVHMCRLFTLTTKRQIDLGTWRSSCMQASSRALSSPARWLARTELASCNWQALRLWSHRMQGQFLFGYWLSVTMFHPEVNYSGLGPLPSSDILNYTFHDEVWVFIIRTCTKTMIHADKCSASGPGANASVMFWFNSEAIMKRDGGKTTDYVLWKMTFWSIRKDIEVSGQSILSWRKLCYECGTGCIVCGSRCNQHDHPSIGVI